MKRKELFKGLRRSQHNRSIVGVCGGISEFFDIPALPVRILFLLIMPAGVVLYLIFANILPEAPASL
ncbi:PspC domain-containing protein [Salibacterium aidingense]|uniref:PspC domain-containing protein n=1 Tax=Salibacterium aidingense TaxID=384933 RepID=UPI000410E09A|nr:PspC domain-containing protein [Salibacterium aidingense]